MRVLIDGRKVAELMRSENGPVVRHLVSQATAVQEEAKRLVGVDSGRLRSSIVKRFVQLPEGPAVEVGSEEPHALLHHEGTRPHMIFPKTARALRFEVGGRVVFAQSVDHPGTKPNRYLVDALKVLKR